MTDRARVVLQALRQAGIPEAEIALAVLELCELLGRVPDTGDLDTIAALTSGDDDDPFVWDNPNFLSC